MNTVVIKGTASPAEQCDLVSNLGNLVKRSSDNILLKPLSCIEPYVIILLCLNARQFNLSSAVNVLIWLRYAIKVCQIYSQYSIWTTLLKELKTW
jgi:hypothetical protein